jgi:hypothetical protein
MVLYLLTVILTLVCVGLFVSAARISLNGGVVPESLLSILRRSL